jgi:hypothetical protein
VEQHARLAVLKEDLESLLTIHDPSRIGDWKPSESQRLAYATLLEGILSAIDSFESLQKQELLDSGGVQTYIPNSLLAFYQEQIQPLVPALKQALRVLDPEGADFREMMEGVFAPRGAKGKLKATFEVGIEQVEALIERNPDQRFDKKFVPRLATVFLDSKLISFDPDAWLDRMAHLAPIRTDRKNAALPVHVRFRIEEIFRAYVIGCWLSVLALSRAVLEYAILDNVHKFKVEPYWPTKDKYGRRSEKSLEQLVNEVGSRAPHLEQAMDKLRQYGNAYMHPKATKLSKEALFQREHAAKDAVSTLITVVEGFYLMRTDNPNGTEEC